MSFTNQLKKATLRTAFGYLEKNPEENALKLMSWAAEYGNKLNLTFDEIDSIIT